MMLHEHVKKIRTVNPPEVVHGTTVARYESTTVYASSRCKSLTLAVAGGYWWAWPEGQANSCGTTAHATSYGYSTQDLLCSHSQILPKNCWRFIRWVALALPTLFDSSICVGLPGGHTGWITLMDFQTNSFVGNCARGSSLHVYRWKQH